MGAKSGYKSIKPSPSNPTKMSPAAMKRADTTTMEKYKMQGVKQHPGMTVSTMKTMKAIEPLRPLKPYPQMKASTHVEMPMSPKGMVSRMMKERGGRISSAVTAASKTGGPAPKTSRYTPRYKKA